MLNTRRSVLSALAAASVAISLLSGCDMLKSGLSSDQEEEIARDIGTASIAGDTWYYNGSSSTNMTASSATNTLAISFSQKVTRSSGGTSATLTLAYTDANGGQSNAVITVSDSDSAKIGVLSGDGKTFNLDMSPVLAYFNASAISNGTADLSVKLSGFISAEGDQAGRQVPTLTKTIAIAPLFSSSTVTGLSFSTVFSTVGKSITIPVNAAVSLEDATDFIVTLDSASTTPPTSISSSDFTLAAASDGLSLNLTSVTNFQSYDFTMYVTVRGIKAATTGDGLSRKFTVTCSPVLITVDGVKDANWTDPAISSYVTDPTDDAYAQASWGHDAGNEASGLYVTNDSTYLYLAMSFSSLSNFWASDILTLLIDTSSTTGGATALAGISNGSWTAPASTSLTATNGEIDFMTYHRPCNGGTGVLYQLTDSTSDTDTELVASWTSSVPANMYTAPWVWTAGSSATTFVEYRIPLATLSLAAGNTLKVFGVVSDHWVPSYATDIVPGSTVLANSATATFDFSTALGYTIK